MTDVGTNTRGVIISTAVDTNAPSGDKVYFLCDDVNRKHNDKNANKHKPGSTHYNINTKVHWWEATLGDCKVKNNTFSLFNTYTALIVKWQILKTPVYLWLKDSATTYLDWQIGSTPTTQDYLECTIKGPYSDNITHKANTINIKVEEI